MIDFHTHILPKLDDGSQSVEESLSMLSSMKAQGVTRVIATPHFLANHESVDEFIDRRNRSYELLTGKSADLPEIVLGAEVKYYDGISRLPELKKLRIENSRLMLLEMPFSTWSEYAIREVIDIASRGKITLVLAHIERYLPMLGRDTLYRLQSEGVFFQVNASFFVNRFSRRRAIKMLQDSQIHFIGSDAHNMSDRSPNTGRAISVIEKKFGNEFAHDFINYGYAMFHQNKLI